MKYKYIFLDLDGTLTDPKEGITKCVQYALSKFGIEESNLDNLIPYIGPPLYVSFTERNDFSHEDARLAIKYYRDRFSTVGLFENKVIPGADEFLQLLVDNSRMPVLATSKPHIYADAIVKKYRLRPYLKFISGSELDGTRDKKSDVIKYAIDKLEISDKSKILMVGDRHHDIDGAKECGIDSCGVTFGYAEPNELEKAGADYIVSDFKELLNICLQR